MSTNIQSKVGVIIANHNYTDYVCQAIESALCQDYSNKEVVVVDDASTDNSVQKIIDQFQLSILLEQFPTDSRLTKYFSKDYKIKLVTCSKNVKQGEARNIAIKECWDRCDYFAILDSDDEMYPSKISKCMKLFEKYGELVGSVHTDYININTETGLEVTEYKPSYNKQLLLMGDCHLHSGGIISKKGLEKVGLFDKDCPPKEDYLMWLKIAHYFLCLHLPEVLVKVRVTPTNSTVIHTQEQHNQQYKLMWERYEAWVNHQ